MSSKNNKKNGKRREASAPDSRERHLHPETMKSIWATALLGLAIIVVLAWAGTAGPAGDFIYQIFNTLLGVGYFILPLALLSASAILILSEQRKVLLTTALGETLIVLSALGLIHIWKTGQGGWLGYALGSLQIPFGGIAASVIVSLIGIIAILVALNAPLKFPQWKRGASEEIPEVTGEAEEDEGEEDPESAPTTKATPAKEDPDDDEPIIAASKEGTQKPLKKIAPSFGIYNPPPLSLLSSQTERPTTGDLRANANIIKRTLESFGIAVEMGEINIGPKVTRYTLKPAEGMKISRITALNQDLALALAAHPIRIEAPIPGKSLVGIEVPNKAAALVRLGSLMAYQEFNTAGLLGFALGRDVTGEPVFADIGKMPHLLVAGATGSGKSVTIHSLIVSLLYKNSPAALKFIMVDPKRVELSAYEGIPHLIGSVITENKKAIGALRFAISEMDRRYDILHKAGVRDIKSFNTSHKDEPLPFIIIVIDELADLMTTFHREVEGAIVRLAQMARATGIHLILATQRPSVEIITGLIKANVTSRIALQVASQIDSRTILDTSGAEKLLGGGDLLFVSAELSKPRRIQGCYLTEEEIHKVADYIRDHNEAIENPEEADLVAAEKAALGNGNGGGPFDDYSGEGSDELLDEAIELVKKAQKASASLLQRRLQVGYARAARLLDLMEERNIIGPGEGAKPREVYVVDDSGTPEGYGIVNDE